MTTIKIDTDETPTLPYESWSIVENKTFGKIAWKPEDYELYLVDEQKTGYISGHSLREKLKDEPVMNLAMAQYLTEHPKLYPKSWKGQHIYFWGTLVQNSDDSLYVPYLIESDGKVVLYWNWLDYCWRSHDPALRFRKFGISSSEPKILPSDTLILARIEKLETQVEKLTNWANRLSPLEL